MKIVKTKTQFLNFKGEGITAEDKTPVVYGTILANLMSGSKHNPTLSWQLGKKFATEDKVELKAEEVVFVKTAISEANEGQNAWLSSILAGQLLEMLETSDAEEVKKK